ncbi:MAG: ankyrin repeat domain-containing protein [Alphaproteobacteria bacterium]
MRKIFLFIIILLMFSVNLPNSYAFFDMDRATFAMLLNAKSPKVRGVYSPFWWNRATLKDVQAEFKNKNSINSPDKEGDTALIVAIRTKKSIEILQYLVSNGADVNYKTPEGKSVLEFALNDKPTLEFLLKSGARVNPRIIAKNFYICENNEVLRLLIA